MTLIVVTVLGYLKRSSSRYYLKFISTQSQLKLLTLKIQNDLID